MESILVSSDERIKGFRRHKDIHDSSLKKSNGIFRGLWIEDLNPDGVVRDAVIRN